MDRFARTADIVKAYYKYKRSSDAASFIKAVCNYFDKEKNVTLSDNDLSFLLFLANEAGIPQYFELLQEKYTSAIIADENINLLTLGAMFHDSSLLRGDNKLHRYQKHVLDKFVAGKTNRYVLTAPTSFGKTFIVYEIISKMKYENILLIFPSISLLSENYTRLHDNPLFAEYQIHSLSEEPYNADQKNIFIFTPERYLSFMDKNSELRFDFSFIDEVYKIDNSFIIDQETVGENERDTAYRLALEFICHISTDMLLAGPYMTLPSQALAEYESFANFARENYFCFIDYNNIEIVDKKYETIKGRHEYIVDEKVISIKSPAKAEKLLNTIVGVSSPVENTIIYCGRRSDTEKYAKFLLSRQETIDNFNRDCRVVTPSIFNAFLDHLAHTFGEDWVVLQALRGRIGIHHSLIPKYIQKEIISLFNQGALICLFSTTTITEGVNTTAKNIVITSNKKGAKPLKQFDAKNIAGRAGRFQQHYVGIVIDLNNGFENIVHADEEKIHHKNYDIDSIKTDVDYQITKDQYLSPRDLLRKSDIQDEILNLGIPQSVFNAFRVVSPQDKLFLYRQIGQLNQYDIQEINQIAIDLARSNASRLNWQGFQRIMDLILPIVHEEKLKNLIERKTGGAQTYSLITVLLNSYLRNGFLGMVEYYTKEAHSKKSKDEAIKTVADFVYNVFKYHLVKYLGIFDVFYRYHIAQITNNSMENVSGLGLLLQKLEYNALNPVARRLSDFGVPFKIVKHYDTDNPAAEKDFDVYEQDIDLRIQRFLS